MGVLSLRDAGDWQHAVLEERHYGGEPRGAGPVGRRAPSPAAHTATSISLDPVSGQLTYGREKKIEVYRGHEKLLPKELQQKLGTREIRGWLFQVRAAGPNPQPDSFASLKGKEILLSKLPHSRNYFVRRTLKSCKHEKAVWKQVARAWDKYADMRLADERLDRILQELSVTPFVSFKGCLAAWAVAPRRFDVLGEERFDTFDDYTIATLEIPFEDAYELLRIDPAIQSTLAATEEGRLFDGYQTVADARAATREGFGPRQAPVRHRVTEELWKNSDKLMEAACWAALCGREVPDAADSVSQSAVLLYHRFAYNFVERERDPLSRPRRAFPEREEAAANPFGYDSCEEKTTSGQFVERWRRLGYDNASEGVTRIINHVLEADEEWIDDGFVNRIRPALAGWPPGWTPPEGLDRALRRVNKLRDQEDPQFRG